MHSDELTSEERNLHRILMHLQSVSEDRFKKPFEFTLNYLVGLLDRAEHHLPAGFEHLKTEDEVKAALNKMAYWKDLVETDGVYRTNFGLGAVIANGRRAVHQDYLAAIVIAFEEDQKAA